MTKARRPTQLPANTLARIARHRAGHIVPKWRSDDAATTVRLLLEVEPALAQADAHDIDDLIDRIAHTDDEHGGKGPTIGGVLVQIGGREIRIGRRGYLASACTKGLFTRETMPREEGVHERTMDRINALLAGKRIKPQIVSSRIYPAHYTLEYAATRLTIICPEAIDETYEIILHIEHKPDAEIERIARETARIIEMRYRRRAAVRRMRDEVEAAIADEIREPTMRVVGSIFNLDSWKAIRNESFAGTAFARIEIIDDTLRPKVVSVGVEGERLKTLTAQHRANRRRLADQEAGAAIACEPVLANAIRALPDRYAAGLLAEIEKIVAGISSNPSEPRRRGISNVSIHRGIVSAAVTIGQGVRLEKGRIRVSSIKTLPLTLLTAMAGRPVRQVIEHELFEGVTIRSAMINGNGLQLRPVQDQPPLAPLLETLRGKVEAHRQAMEALATEKDGATARAARRPRADGARDRKATRTAANETDNKAEDDVRRSGDRT